MEKRGLPAAQRDEPATDAERLVALGRALSDPIRVRMLAMLAEAAASGRGCCNLPDFGVPAEENDGSLCVCELQEVFSMGQSKVSYHIRKLREAGLIVEEKRGKWSFYALDRETVRDLLADLESHLRVSPDHPTDRENAPV